MRCSLFKWVCVGLVCFLPLPLLAQQLEDYLARYGDENGKKYLQPLGDAFGAGLNSGLYHSAHIPRMGLRIGLDLVVTNALISDEQKSFSAQTEDPFYPSASREVPTVFGKNQSVPVTGTGGTVYNFPGGYEVNSLPVLMPQVTVGALFGTEATVRYLALQLNKDIGDLSLVGYGVRHSISQYIPLLPVDLAVSYFHQNFSLGDIVDAKTDYIGIQASRSMSLLTLYGGLGYESATINISYEQSVEDEIEKIAFDLTGQNKVRLTLGASVQLAIFRLHADYNLAAQKIFSLGLYFGI